MNDMIKMILDMDGKAREITQDAEKTKLYTRQNLNKCKTEIKSKYLERAHIRVEKNAQQERLEAEKDALEAKKRYENKTRELEAIYKEKGSAWVDEIYNRIIMLTE